MVTTRMMICILGILSCLALGSGCLFFRLREPLPQEHPDFDCYPLDFRVGDCFELKKTAFLMENKIEGRCELELDFRAASISALEDYSVNPWKYPTVVRVVPAGEDVEVFSLKATLYHRRLLVYLRLQTGEKWVIAYRFEDYPGYYNRDLFRKVSAVFPTQDGDTYAGPQYK